MMSLNPSILIVKCMTPRSGLQDPSEAVTDKINALLLYT